MKVRTSLAGGGRRLYEASPSELIAFAKSVHHFALVEIKEDSLKLSAIDEEGEVFDSFSIQKNSGDAYEDNDWFFLKEDKAWPTTSKK